MTKYETFIEDLGVHYLGIPSFESLPLLEIIACLRDISFLESEVCSQIYVRKRDGVFKEFSAQGGDITSIVVVPLKRMPDQVPVTSTT